MPMIDLTFVRGSIDEQALSRLADELVTALLRAERAPDKPYLRDNTLVYLHAMEPAEVSVGGRGPGDPRFRVDLTVFAGAVDKDHKEQLAADVHAAVCAAAGIEPLGSKGISCLGADSRNSRRELGRRRQGHLLRAGERPCVRRLVAKERLT